MPITCPKCGSKDIIDEYTDVIYAVVDLKCLSCWNEFKRKIEED